MQFAMKPLIEVFEAQSRIQCELVISSSGKLTAQIKEGAPYDVFMSANMTYPNEIYNSGFAEQPPEVYASGKLVLWTTNLPKAPSLNKLLNDNIKHIALANSKTAPYGIAAIETLEAYGLLDSLRSKLVYGESLSQVNQFITSKSSEVGFTALSVVLSERLKNKGQWLIINKNLYTPIRQGVVLIKKEVEGNSNAQEFYQFLFSKEAQEILKKFGYSVEE